MKKKLILLLIMMVSIILTAQIIILIMGQKKSLETVREDSKLKVVATFYPVYMIGLNIADHEDRIEVKSLTKLNTGCLHDYQLTTEDMKLISSADILVVNGGGMEGFLEDVRTNYPNLTIIDASQGIQMLPNDVSEEVKKLSISPEGGEYNPHVWLDPELYIKQIENVRDGLKQYLKENNWENQPELSMIIDKNSSAYIDKVKELDNKIIDYKESISNSTDPSEQKQQAVIFHDSFAYLAYRAGIKIAFSVPLDSDTALSAGDIAEIVDSVKENHIKFLFTEEQFSDSIAKQIAEETAAKVYIIDSAVTGDGAKDSYIKAMQINIEVLKSALKEGQ